MAGDLKEQEMTVGWVGVGRMGSAMVKRLLSAGADVTVYNRTKAKVEPLVELGAKVADSISDLTDKDIVFTMLSGPADVSEIIAGPNGLLSVSSKVPKIIVDCTTISMEAAAQVRAAVSARGAEFLDAPVSGNPSVVAAGLMSFICSGKRECFDRVSPYLNAIARSSTYAGEGELARIVKICHNTYLGIIIQALAETTVLANKAGVPRHAFLEFVNNSPLGSMFSRYKTPALVNLDFKPTFTPPLLQKDMDLGLAAARALHVSMPIASVTRELVQNLVARGYVDCDFAALIELEAEASGMKLTPENVQVDTGL
jgi:3-hydroxyisobutyrate dehydrogenase